MPDTPKIAAGYTRFSPRPDADECESNLYQIRFIRDYCRRNGYVLPPELEFSDADVSANDEDRPKLWNAIESLRRGMVLVVHKSDRLARSVYLEEYIRRAVAKKGARIEVIDSKHNGDSLDDVLVRQILAAVAEHRKKADAARTKAASLNYQANGRAMSKLPPYGKMEGPPIEITRRNGEKKLRRTWVDNPAEQTIRREIITLHEDGMKPAQIARELRARGREPRKGGPWHTEQILRIIRRHREEQLHA